MHCLCISRHPDPYPNAYTPNDFLLLILVIKTNVNVKVGGLSSSIVVAHMNTEVQNNMRVRPWDDIEISRPPGLVGRYGDDMDDDTEDGVGNVPISLGSNRRIIDLRIEYKSI